MAAVSQLHLDVEMETGTGKTYCYIKSMFELNRRYGWSKFIIIVLSIAIREGVAKSLSITAEHFAETYGKNARFFISNRPAEHTSELQSLLRISSADFCLKESEPGGRTRPQPRTRRQLAPEGALV